MEIYRDFSLRWVTVAVAVLLAVAWIGGLIRTGKFRGWLTGFSRSIRVGIVLLTVDVVWCTAIVAAANSENLLAPKSVGYALIWGLYVGSIIWRLEFMSVRALAAFLLLVAKVMVDAAFLVETPAKLVVTVLAYVWVILAMWWALSPWRCRNALAWIAATEDRCILVSSLHVALAAVLIMLAVACY